MTPPNWDEAMEQDSPWIDEYEEESYSSPGSPLIEDEENIYDEEDMEDEEFEDAEAEEDELEALIDEGEALIEEGEYDAAMAQFREAFERFPESEEAACHVGETALMLFTDGIEELANGDWEDDDDLQAYWDEGTGAFEAALGIDEECYPALNGLGAFQLLVGNREQALDYWERSLDINEDQEDITAALEDAKD